MSTLDAFMAALPFQVDDFQKDALVAVEAGKSVVVTAPTGAGKTVVADGSIAMCLARGARAFYTTPIKALSNQKFADLTDAHGRDNVGLLTGDNVINGDASIIVMTTEVLRNMIYENAPALNNLGLVVLDEVHYLADKHRGSVWEEIIIHLPLRITLVCLSATIANPKDFTEWVSERRGGCELIVETERPVPLTSMYMWRDRHAENRITMLPTLGNDGRPNQSIVTMLRGARGRHPRFSAPRRVGVVRELERDGLLPCIYFVFSRKGCDTTASEIASADFAFTSPNEQRDIRAIARSHVQHLSGQDLTVLGYERWIEVLEQGVASHHAGLIPAFKETVEELFLCGLVQVVAATETLALGINMPARTVVIDSLSKYNGETHDLLTPSDYTQLTGRAGRRGVDTEGTAVVIFSSYVSFDQVTAIAAKGANPLRSSFSPTYNMVVNLMSRYDEDTAHRLLESSFANFSLGRRTEGLRASLAQANADLQTYRDAAECEFGDIWDTDEANLRVRAAKTNTQLLQPGSVVDISGQRMVILSRSWGGDQPRLALTTSSGGRRTIRTRDLPRSARFMGELTLPTPRRPQDSSWRAEVGGMLETFVPDEDPIDLFQHANASGAYGCIDIETHLEWVHLARRTERDIKRLRTRIKKAQSTDIRERFNSLSHVLESTGYISGWNLTKSGKSLRRLYNELDLLLAESLRSGVLSDASSQEFAALVSMFTYQARGGEVSEHPKAVFAQDSVAAVTEIAGRIAEMERRSGLVETRPPDVGLIDSIYAWACGLELADIFDEDDLRAGDFVRSTRQLLDLLRQIRDGFAGYQKVAADAIKLLDRGIVEAAVLR